MSGKPMFVGNRVVGALEDGVFEQVITYRHVYRRELAKGMDINLHRALKGQCRIWKLIFRDTGEVLTIPFERIELSGYKVKAGGVGEQWMVKLEYFDRIKVGAQRRMV